MAENPFPTTAKLAAPKRGDSIDAAIHTAESLFASLLERPAPKEEARTVEVELAIIVRYSRAGSYDLPNMVVATGV